MCLFEFMHSRCGEASLLSWWQRVGDWLRPGIWRRRTVTPQTPVALPLPYPPPPELPNSSKCFTRCNYGDSTAATPAVSGVFAVRRRCLQCRAANPSVGLHISHAEGVLRRRPQHKISRQHAMGVRCATRGDTARRRLACVPQLYDGQLSP